MKVKKGNQLLPRLMFTPKEIAAMFAVPLATVRRWQKLGCPFVSIGSSAVGRGRETRLDVEYVKKWLKSRSAAAVAKATAEAKSAIVTAAAKAAMVARAAEARAAKAAKARAVGGAKNKKNN